MIFTNHPQAYVYKWIELATGKWYIGSRTRPGAHPDDGYICSSRKIKPLIKESPNAWQREILATGEATEMLELETKLLVELDAKNDPMSYNLHNGDGKFTTLGMEPWNKGKGKPIGKPSWNAGLTKESHPSLAKMANTRKGQPAPNKGKPMSKEQRLKMVEIHQNRSEDTCKKISEALKGRTQPEEANLKRSEKLKGRTSPMKGRTYVMSEETKQKISAAHLAKKKGT